MKPNTKPNTIGRRVVPLTFCAALIYGLSGGFQASYGVLLGAISQNSGMDYAAVSFVLAVTQLVYGVMQPVFGLVSMRRSNAFVLRCGVVLLVGGMLLLPWCRSLWALLVVLGGMLPSAAAALSFGMVMQALSPQLSEESAPAASGVVTASNGVGSTILAPVIQGLLTAAGLLGTMVFLSVPALLLLPVSVYLCRRGGTKPQGERKEGTRLSGMVREAVRLRDYRFLMVGFFTCGFHMAIVETHFFTEITTLGFSGRTAAYTLSVYGIAAILGAVISGALCGRFPMKTVLGWLYASRTGMILAFLLLPKSAWTVYGFAALLGLTGNATVPPTSGLTERLFGAVKLATLFGVVFFVHQIGSFFSAWLGGVCLTATGGYAAIWLADAAFSGVAAIASWRIRRDL